VLDKISGIEARFEEIEREMAQQASDYQRVVELSKERARPFRASRKPKNL
jgi:hypothetical protein